MSEPNITPAEAPAKQEPTWYCPECGARFMAPGVCSNAHPPTDLRLIADDEPKNEASPAMSTDFPGQPAGPGDTITVAPSNDPVVVPGNDPTSEGGADPAASTAVPPPAGTGADQGAAASIADILAEAGQKIRDVLQNL